MSERVRVGIIGFGFMGRTHAGAYAWARRAGVDVEVTVVADERGEAALGSSGGNLGSSGPVDLEGVRVVTSAAELLEDPGVDLVSVCTPTPTHVELAVSALRSGKHVLVEKPVALSSAEAGRLLAEADAAARERGLLCVPAMCMRWWPQWSWLRDTIGSGALGPVLSASFTRVGGPPGWSSFYADPSRSGGAILDLHVHDVDFVLHALGAPARVLSRGSAGHVVTFFDVPGGPGQVLAAGGWLRSMPFRMRYLVEFEGGVADFDLGRTPPLLLHGQQGSRAVSVAEGTGYDHQAAGVVRAVARGTGSPVPLAEAVEGLRLIEAERRSLVSGAWESVSGSQ